MMAAFVFSLTLAYTGMVLQCLAMEKHWKKLAHPALKPELRKLCRPLGYILFAAAAYACMYVWPVAEAWVAWFGMISLAGLALLILLPYQRKLALSVPLIGSVLSLLLVVVMP